MALVVGLTGGIGSGKSTAAGIFRKLGVHLVDADQVAREIVEPRTTPWRRVVEAFGDGILLEDGRLDRPRLAAIIFADADKRRLLEGILHPTIAAEVDQRVADLRRRHPGGIVMVDAALMVETGRHKRVEKLIVVWADEEAQLRRLMAREGFDRDKALRRVRAQMPLAVKVRFADYVIDNSGPRKALRAEVERVHRELATLATLAGRGGSGGEAPASGT